MDNGLVRYEHGWRIWFHRVLILIVVDNGLVQRAVDQETGEIVVLILIVVDNGLVHLLWIIK